MSGHRIRIEPAGWQVQAQPTQTLMDAALAAGVSLPRSCRNGTCRTCLCQLLSGQVRYRIDWPGVSADERAQGWILPCVAVACTDVVLDVPHAERPGGPAHAQS